MRHVICTVIVHFAAKEHRAVGIQFKQPGLAEQADKFIYTGARRAGGLD
jgi:hypothetical protein